MRCQWRRTNFNQNRNCYSSNDDICSNAGDGLTFGNLVLKVVGADQLFLGGFMVMVLSIILGMGNKGDECIPQGNALCTAVKQEWIIQEKERNDKPGESQFHCNQRQRSHVV